MRRVPSALVLILGAGLALQAPRPAQYALIVVAALFACREATRLAASALASLSAGRSGGEAGAGGRGWLDGLGFLLTALVAFALWPGHDLAPVAIAAGAAVTGGAALHAPSTPGGLARVSGCALAALWVGAPAASLAHLVHGPEPGAALLFLLLAVFVPEAAALFAGRLIGGARLAPVLSPGKTWAGLFAQLAAGGVVGGAAASLVGVGSLAGATIGLVLAGFAVLGDLFESFWKRAADRKDSGRLIPGHGGVLDRVDGLLFAAPAFHAALAFLG